MNLETEGKISQAVPNFLKHYYFRSNYLRCSVKKVFLEISHNSQDNTCARDSFLIKLQARLATLLKKSLWYRYFPVNFAKFLRTPFSQNTSGRLLLFIRVMAAIFQLSLSKVVKFFVLNLFMSHNSLIVSNQK